MKRDQRTEVKKEYNACMHQTGEGLNNNSSSFDRLLRQRARHTDGFLPFISVQSLHNKQEIGVIS